MKFHGIRAYAKPGKWEVMYMCVSGIDISSVSMVFRIVQKVWLSLYLFMLRLVNLK